MGKVILVCGKIGSGKTTYAHKLAAELGAVIFSHDEIILGLFGASLYENDRERFHQYAGWVEAYVKRKSGEAAKAGATVICANGFWSRAERDALRKYYAAMGVACALHYIDTPEEQRREYIKKRNNDIRNGSLGYIITDENDINHFFEAPEDDEIDDGEKPCHK
ncbi:MAG: ATP-binding protein [Defluviitaleaceae bacterium]|nr:ATP-binding protein [Defluviitaleaceae bacterium]MCL2239603.1 ATP-binding protein [Defluviitaleaceae bacterium]